MASGDETVLELTGKGSWHYAGPADVKWTGANDASGEVRWTATTSVDPASANGRLGMPVPTSEFKQAGDGDAGLHIHFTGPERAKVVVLEGV